MYGTLEGFRTYAADRGNMAPTEATDEAATAALVRGSDYIRFRYVPNLMPGYGVDYIPPGSTLPLTEEGAYLAAEIELENPGFFSGSFTPAQAKVLTEVRGIKWTVVGNSDGSYSQVPTSNSIDMLFLPYCVDRDATGLWLASVGPGTGVWTDA